MKNVVDELRGVASGDLRACVVGKPISHSLSPMIHSYAYRELGIDANYTAKEYTKHEFRQVLKKDDYNAFSVTMPLKKVAAECADVITQRVHETGYANTLIQHNNHWYADNTDIYGIAQMITPVINHKKTTTHQDDHSVPRTDAIVIGTGATAHSALYAFREAGVLDAVVSGRNDQALPQLQKLFSQLTFVALPNIPSGNIIFNTVPAGAHIVLNEKFPSVFFDVAYFPWPSSYAQHATELGYKVVSGIWMLLHQAIKQVEIFTGKTIDIHSVKKSIPRSFFDF